MHRDGVRFGMLVARAESLPKFIEEMKASGFVARALEKAGVRGVRVPEKARD